MKTMAEEFAGTPYAPARLFYLGGIFAEEYLAALVKHPPEEWASMHPAEMHRELLKETAELKRALIASEQDGDHGIIREAVHVQVVAQRIIDEMRGRLHVGT